MLVTAPKATRKQQCRNETNGSETNRRKEGIARCLHFVKRKA
jgi:hypothetical protein